MMRINAGFLCACLVAGAFAPSMLRDDASSSGVATFVSRDDVLLRAARALGVDGIRTLQFAGSGAEFSVGQNFTPTEAWPRVALTHFDVLINYETASMRLDLRRTMGTRMPRGGGVPFTGEQHEIQTVSGPYAWDTPVPPDQSAGALPDAWCTPPEAGGTSPVSAPSPASQPACMLLLWGASGRRAGNSAPSRGARPGPPA